MWKRFIVAVINDRTRALSIITGALVGLAALAAVQLKLEMTLPTEVLLTTTITAVVGWVLDALGGEANARGAEKAQRQIARLNSSQENDRYLGPRTIKRLTAIVDEVQDRERKSYHGR